MTTRKRRRDSLLANLERTALDMLKKTDLTNQERLKALEVGAKVAAIKHKISDGDDKDGSFFSDK